MFLFAIIYRNGTEWLVRVLTAPWRVRPADDINNNEMSTAIFLGEMSRPMISSAEMRVRKGTLIRRERTDLIEKTYPFHCCYHAEHDKHCWHWPCSPMRLDSYLYLTKNVSIECHRCASNDDSAASRSGGDENAAVVDETDDSRAKDDDQEDELNTKDAMEVVAAAAVIVAAVENGLMTVGEVVAEDDGEDCDGDDENDEDDAKGGQDDEAKQEVSIVKLSSSMNSVMMAEAK